MREEWLDFEQQRVRIKRRRRQRSLKVHVQIDGEVLVTAALSLPDRVIRRFLAESWSWVESTQLKMAERRKSLPPPKQFREGELLHFQGHPTELTFKAAMGKTKSIYYDGARLVAKVSAAEWSLFNPQAPHPEWLKPMRRFYEAEGRRVLTERVDMISRLMGIGPSRLVFRCQRTRWGSCSSAGVISLNWRLIAAPQSVMDYVIVHEIAHLRHPNHSRRFWSHVAEFSPLYRDHVKWLRTNHAAFDFLLPKSVK